MAVPEWFQRAVSTPREDRTVERAAEGDHAAEAGARTDDGRGALQEGEARLGFKKKAEDRLLILEQDQLINLIATGDGT